jgi:hypothetical protein
MMMMMMMMMCGTFTLTVLDNSQRRVLKLGGFSISGELLWVTAVMRDSDHDTVLALCEVGVLSSHLPA